ncbi:hypothetical protein DFH07DRAFT_763758 [Mycena maculata]|uniref:Uncharacterized protein n=1 Tax=Mycena maculata TaxID=230809 RepID=A0AAD7KI51_9AGAR|nr:hypothetical protein DFH07DRAFT_763758 [Mycena maculata]
MPAQVLNAPCAAELDGSSPMVGTQTYQHQPALLIVQFGGTLHDLWWHPSELSWLKTQPSSGTSSPMGIMPMVKPAFVPSPSTHLTTPFLAPNPFLIKNILPLPVTPTNEPTSEVYLAVGLSLAAPFDHPL